MKPRIPPIVYIPTHEDKERFIRAIYAAGFHWVGYGLEAALTNLVDYEDYTYGQFTASGEMFLLDDNDLQFLKKNVTKTNSVRHFIDYARSMKPQIDEYKKVANEAQKSREGFVRRIKTSKRATAPAKPKPEFPS